MRIALYSASVADFDYNKAGTELCEEQKGLFRKFKSDHGIVLLLLGLQV